MKTHPVVVEDTGAKRRSVVDTKKLISEIVDNVSRDDKDRSRWLQKGELYEDRRYVREGLDTGQPWPGASDIVIPVMDMQIDRMKATYSRLTFTRPMVDFQARSPGSVLRSVNARGFFDYLLNDRMWDFKKQVIIGIDNMLQWGSLIFKVYWDYQTRKVTRILRKEKLPAEFQKLIEISPALLRQFQEFSGQNVTENSINRFISNERRGVFEQREAQVKSVIEQKYNLDPDETVDKNAINDIFAFFRDGADEVRYKTREVIRNEPRVVALDHKDFLVPRDTGDLQSAKRCTHRVYLTETTLKRRAADHDWSKAAVKTVIERAQSKEGGGGSTRSGPHSDSIARTRDMREGIHSGSRTELIEIWEHYWYMDIDGDGDDELVYAPIHPGTNTLMRDIREVPYEHNKLPFVKIDFEINSPRYYSSRGIPEKIDYLDESITTMHRAKLNQIDLMAPMFTYRYGSEINPEALSFIPGQVIPVMNPDDYKVLDIPDRTLPNEREENNLFTLIQRYIGGLDTGLVSQDNISEARTATEIAAIQRTASEIVSARGEIFQLGMKDVYNQVWDLWNQYGWKDDAVWVRLTGSDPIRMTKEEIKGDFDIVPIGTVATTDPEQERQKALQRLQLLIAAKQLGPQILGFEVDIDIGAALRLYLMRDNANDMREVLKVRDEEMVKKLQEEARRQIEAVQAAERNEPQTAGQALEASRLISQKSPFGNLQQISSAG